jgi:hypothetical protein
LDLTKLECFILAMLTLWIFILGVYDILFYI